MAIEPFQIVNADGSINQSEYTRCINFLNDYINGNIKVYHKVTWTNPLEVDLSTDESSLEILTRIVNFTENRLLNVDAFNNIKRLFTGILDRYGSTIHTCGRYLEASANFTDGPGYMYDVLSPDETRVLKHQINDEITVYYLDDDNKTILEYNDTAYAQLCSDSELPTCNFPQLSLTSNRLTSNVDTYPNLYHGYLSGVYSEFQRLSGQYVGSSTLFYFSECNDILYTTGANSYQDTRLNEIINFNYKASVSNKTIPTRGIDLSKVKSVQDAVVNPGNANAYVMATAVNSEVDYLSPVALTSLTETDWIKIWQDETQTNV